MKKPEETQTSISLRQWNAGEAAGMNSLLERHLPWIRNHVRRRMGPMLRQKAETEDCVQDAMIQFLQYGPRVHLSSDREFRAL
ncbi:MAG: sigma factor, partial [Planctomycetota bacterium]